MIQENYSIVEKRNRSIACQHAIIKKSLSINKQKLCDLQLPNSNFAFCMQSHCLFVPADETNTLEVKINERNKRIS
jgi:hypothetical protein